MTKEEMEVERIHVPRELRKSRSVPFPLAAGRCGGCAPRTHATHSRQERRARGGMCVWRQSQRYAREMGTAKNFVYGIIFFWYRGKPAWRATLERGTSARREIRRTHGRDRESVPQLATRTTRAARDGASITAPYTRRGRWARPGRSCRCGCRSRATRSAGRRPAA